MRRRLWLVLAALLATGCVSRNNHELVKMQLDATRTALSTHQLTAREEAELLRVRVAELETDLVEARLRFEEHEVLESHIEQELETLRVTLAETLARIPAPPSLEEAPPAPPPRRTPRKPEIAIEPPLAFEPVIAASVSDMVDALHVRELTHFEEARREKRHSAVTRQFAPLLEEGWAEIEYVSDASVVRIRVAKLFVEGKTMLSPRGEAILADSATALRGLPGYDLEIRGHTNDRPHHSAEHPSNWELGFDRAVVFLRVLKENDVPQRMSASSHADTQPLVSNETPEGRKENARIELWLRPLPEIKAVEGGEEIGPADEPAPDPQQPPEPVAPEAPPSPPPAPAP